MNNPLQTIKSPFVLFLVSVVAIGAIVLFFTSHPGGPALLSVVSSVPSQSSTLNPFSPIIIVFNRPPAPNEYTVIVTPSTDFSITSPTNTSIQIKPASSFKPQTLYTVSISTNPPYVLSFTTQQEADNAPGWNTMFNQIEQTNQLQYATQGALLEGVRKNAPIKQSNFTIDYSYDSDVYTVTLVAPYDQSKSSFLSWLARGGVKDTSGMTIRYIDQ